MAYINSELSNGQHNQDGGNIQPDSGGGEQRFEKDAQQSTLLLGDRSNKDDSKPALGRMSAWAKNAGISIFALCISEAWKADKEPRKVILSDNPLMILSRCWIHVLPLTATVVLTWLNAGYFIGDTLTGKIGDTYQNLDRLGLQVASKILELLIIASTGKVVIACVRYGLLKDSDGVPLGLLMARLNFTQIAYLWDPAFFSGVSAVRGKRRKTGIALFVIICAIVAAFAGPAAAFLIIPTYRYDWPGGGTDFILKGAESYYFPSTIDETMIGPTFCQNPAPAMVNAETRDVQTCLWCGYPSIKRYLKQRPLFWNSEFGETYNFTLVDPLVTRQLTISQSLPWNSDAQDETWGTGVPRVVAALNAYVTGSWVAAIYNAVYSRRVANSYSNFKYRDIYGGWRQISTPVPAVRTQCFFWNDAVDPGPVYKFPYLPLFEQHAYTYYGSSDTSVPDIHNISAFSVSLPQYSTQNGSITSQWIPVPFGEPPKLANGTHGHSFPSAMMAIRLPFPNNNSMGQTLTCSVDARWAQGLLVSSTNRNLMSDLEGVPSTGRQQVGVRPFSPINDGSWRTVTFSTNWLDAITPLMPSHETRNDPRISTVDDLLTDALLYSESSTHDQGRSWFQDGCNFYGNSSLRVWQPTNSTIGDCMGEVSTRAEVIITAIVLDAMSRVNSPSDPGGNINQSVQLGGWLDDGTQYNALLRGKASSQRHGGGDMDPSHMKLRWEVFISGYAYTLNGAAGALSLAILYLHAALVMCHVVWMFWRRESSDAWETPEEMVALAMTSEPPGDGVLQNAASGIRCRRTFETKVHVRAHANRFYAMKGSMNEVGMGFGGQEGKGAGPGVGEGKVRPNRSY